MPKPLAVDIPHNLTEAEAKARLINGLTEARAKHGKYLANFTETWTGNHMEFSGTIMAQGVSGRIDVLPQVVHVEVDLPMLLALIAKNYIPQVEAEGRRMLEKK